MIAYFKLHCIMINRRLSGSGHPVIGCLLLLLALLVFIGLSVVLFQRLSYASYIYIFVALYFVSKLSETKRNDFLKICFGNERYRKLRIVENLIVVLPFVAFLIYKQQFYPVIMLVVIAVLMSLIHFKATYSMTIPTPFYRKPFEFTVGFRNTFFMFFIAYGLTSIAIVVDNFNLGITFQS